eukprot:TRINITY_DN14936_c1_g2_i1.p1 TRINITY_DN14936_c1_g2~~TRINITY_DN14936_c1_g2_i1.p1  ORF type:complete len:569 (+),score=103.95 TRINITY_DN14936_c1_g2_i1:116-1822(+)
MSSHLPSSPTHAADALLETDSEEGSDIGSPYDSSGSVHRSRHAAATDTHGLSGSNITLDAVTPPLSLACDATRTVSVVWLLERLASALDSDGGDLSRRLVLQIPATESRSVPVEPILSELQVLLRGLEIAIPLNWIGILPRELLVVILSYLSADMVVRADKVCVEWRRAVSSRAIWRNLCARQWPRFSEQCDAALELGDTREVDGAARLVSAGSVVATERHEPPPENSLVSRSGCGSSSEVMFWRRAYSRKEARERVWLSPAPRGSQNRFPCTQLIKQANGIHCVQYDSTDLLTGSGSGNEVGIWDMGMLERGDRGTKCIKGTLTGHTSAVTCLQFDADRVYSGSLDSTVRLWSRADNSCLRVLDGHTDKVWCVEYSGGRVVSGSSDRTVRIWDTETGECLTSLKDHRTSVSCVRTDCHLVVSGSAGNSIRVWDIGGGQPVCVHKLRGHQKGVFCLRFDAAKIVSASLDNTIRVWDRRDHFRCVHVMSAADRTPSADDSNKGIISFAYDDTKIVSGGADNLVKVWDMRKWSQVFTLAGHEHWITSLQFDDGKIVTGSRDKSVKMWNVV